MSVGSICAMPAGRFYLRLSGMNAVHAVRALNTALGGLDGVTHLDVKMGEAVIAHDGRLTEALVRDAVKQAGLGIVSLAQDRRRRLPFLE
jgi:copper chaperone CopZ